MIWQDYVLTTVYFLFSYALIPQIYQGFKQKKKLINLQTSLITSLGLFVVTFCFFTLTLYFSAIISFISGILWIILVAQGIIYR